MQRPGRVQPDRGVLIERRGCAGHLGLLWCVEGRGLGPDLVVDRTGDACRHVPVRRSDGGMRRRGKGEDEHELPDGELDHLCSLFEGRGVHHRDQASGYTEAW